MVKLTSHINGKESMTVVNTIHYTNVEVPLSTNAKAVWITHAELDPSTPDNTATKSARVMALLLAGKKAPVSISLSQEGAIASIAKQQLTDGADPIEIIQIGPDDVNGAFPIAKEQDGKYYFTPACSSLGNTAAGEADYRIDFLMEF